MKATTAERAGGRRGQRPGADRDRVRRGRPARLVGAVEDLTGARRRPLRRAQPGRLLPADHARSAASTCASRPRSTTRCPAPGSPPDPQTISGSRRAGVRPAAAWPARGRPVADPAPAGLPGRGGRQGPVRTTLTDPAKLAGLVQTVQSVAGHRRRTGTCSAFAQQAADIAGGNLRFLTIPTRGAGDQRSRRRPAGRRGRGARVRRALASPSRRRPPRPRGTQPRSHPAADRA